MLKQSDFVNISILTCSIKYSIGLTASSSAVSMLTASDQCRYSSDIIRPALRQFGHQSRTVSILTASVQRCRGSDIINPVPHQFGHHQTGAATVRTSSDRCCNSSVINPELCRYLPHPSSAVAVRTSLTQCRASSVFYRTGVIETTLAVICYYYPLLSTFRLYSPSIRFASS